MSGRTRLVAAGSAVCFDQVTYTYPGATAPALRDVSLRIEPGELCVLAGLSGHGKSTFLRAACGLAPHFHGGTFAGRVSIAGLDTRTHPPAQIGAVAGVLFQDPETQLVMGTVRSEIEIGIESRTASAAGVARGVEEVALALGIERLLDRPTHELSGGEKQRVALAAALAGGPQVVLLDEPTSQLDPVAGDELIGLLRRINQEWDVTVVLCEHRLERCLSAADRVIALHRGRIAHDGPPAGFLRWAATHAPLLQTPGARLFALAGLAGQAPPVGVKQARAALRREGSLAPSGRLVPPGLARPGTTAGDASAWPAGQAEREVASAATVGRTGGKRRWLAKTGKGRRALDLRKVWFEVPRGPAILRGVDLAVAAGESVALMGRNGAGKSTLLRHAAGLLAPTRGRVWSAGRVALLLQDPGDYFLRERVREELPAQALRAAGLEHVAERNPRDISGGERQRLALAIVAGHGEPPAALALDEPTRGMDRESKAQLARELARRAADGQAVIVATHDPEFAAAFAQRVVMMADGRVIADGSAAELLSGGWYFATETARILGGAGGALLPEQGAQLLARVPEAVA